MSEKKLRAEQLQLKQRISELTDQLHVLESNFERFTKMVSKDMKKILTMVKDSTKV